MDQRKKFVARDALLHAVALFFYWQFLLGCISPIHMN